MSQSYHFGNDFYFILLTFNTAPDDYSSTSVVLTFPANQQTVSTSIPITDDGINERVETFTATLSSPSGGATLGTASTAICSIQTTRK